MNELSLASELSATAKAEVVNALCQQGNRKGLIKKSCPAYGRLGFLGWNAIMMNIQPVRCRMWSLMCLDETERGLFNELEAWATKHADYLNQHLQRPFEFNLYHWRAA